MECYSSAEKMTSIFAKLLCSLSFVIIVGTACSAVAVTVQKVLVNGNDMEESYLLFVLCSMPFKVDTWPRFAVASIWTDVTYTTLILSGVIQAIIQMSLCFYFIAVIRNLQNMAKKLSEIK